MEHQNIPWEAISAQLKNEASDSQKQQIQDWLALSPDHAAILSEVANTWSVTRKKPEFYLPNIDQNWMKLMGRINYRPSAKAIPMVYFRWISAAAVIVLVFLAGFGIGNGFWGHQKQLVYTKIVAPEGSKTHILLPDSTLVWLNSGSELQYPSDFSAKNRNVIMKGECYFDVVHDASHPFVVSGSEFKVKVYGTKFNVNENGAKNSTDITLISGKVEVLNQNNSPLTELKPGQEFVCTEGLCKVRNAANMEATTAWLSNTLIFDNQSFEEIIPYLEKWYGVKIHLSRSLYYAHNYTFKVKAESLREVLELISVITPIDYHIEGEEVTIKYRKK